MELPKVQEEIGKFLQKLEEQKGAKPPPKKALQGVKPAKKPKKEITLPPVDVSVTVTAEPSSELPSLSVCPYEKFEEVKDYLLEKKKAGKPFNMVTVAKMFKVKYDDTFKNLWAALQQVEHDIDKEKAKEIYSEGLEIGKTIGYALAKKETIKPKGKPVKKAKTYADLDSLDQAEILTLMAKHISEGMPYANVLADVMDNWHISHDGLMVAWEQATAAIAAFKQKSLVGKIEESKPVTESKETTDQAIIEYVKGLLSYWPEMNYPEIKVTVLAHFPLLHPSDHLTMLIEGVVTEHEAKAGVFPVTDQVFGNAAEVLAKKKEIVESFMGMEPPIPKHLQQFIEQLEVAFEALVQTMDSPFVPPAIVIWQGDDGLSHFQVMPEGLGVAEPPHVSTDEAYAVAAKTQVEMLKVVKQNQKLMELQLKIYDEIKDAIVLIAEHTKH